MLENYAYCPANFPAIFFDVRFAKKYGIAEAIIFNDLYYSFTESLKMMLHRYKTWGECDGWIKEGGYWWERYTADYLFGRYKTLYDEQTHKNAIKNLCDRGLLYLRPSLTEGYYWLRIGEEVEVDE